MIIPIFINNNNNTNNNNNKNNNNHKDDYDNTNNNDKSNNNNNNNNNHDQNNKLTLKLRESQACTLRQLPVVIGGLSLVKRGTKKYISKISGNIKIEQVQKCVLPGLAHILRRSLPIK